MHAVMTPSISSSPYISHLQNINFYLVYIIIINCSEMRNIQGVYIKTGNVRRAGNTILIPTKPHAIIIYLLLCLKSKVLSNCEFEAQEDILKVFLERNVCVEVYNISKYICLRSRPVDSDVVC